MNPIAAFQGIPVFVSLLHTTKAETPSFPESRHRSRRVHKKLVKRLGAQWPQIPAIFQSTKGYFMHPVMFEELKAQAQKDDLRHPLTA